jgi:hypothetical protein
LFFHKRNKVGEPHCTECPEPPECKECPAGKILYMGKCLTPKPCGPEVYDPVGVVRMYWQNCLLQGPPGDPDPKKKEAVQCCTFHTPAGDIRACNPAPWGSGGCADPGPIYP